MRFILILLCLALGLMQLWTVPHENPAVVSDLAAPEPVNSILRRACYDCHSNETNWPWYSYVAPISWLVAEHIYEGREELNFSKWGSYSRGAKARHLSDSIVTIEDGSMPTWDYLITHPDSVLSDEDKRLVREWAFSYFEVSDPVAD